MLIFFTENMRKKTKKTIKKILLVQKCIFLNPTEVLFMATLY